MAETGRFRTVRRAGTRDSRTAAQRASPEMPTEEELHGYSKTLERTPRKNCWPQSQRLITSVAIAGDRSDIEEKKPEEDRLCRQGDRADSRHQRDSRAGTRQFNVSFAGCCQPVPGDDVVGFITRGRGVTIHQANCQLALDIEAAFR